MSILTDNSNWVIKNSLIQGGLPYSQKDYNILLGIGVNVFINLMGTREYNSGKKHINKFNYRNLKHPKSVEYYNIPITDLKIISDKEACKIVDLIVKKIEEDKVVYVHCLGGNGRSGTINALVLHRLYPKMSYKEIIEKLNYDRSKRKYKPNNITPQTASQFNQIHRIVTGSDDIYFYEPSSPYYFLSNYYSDTEVPITYIGKKWPSLEHFYQYFKFVKTPRGKEYAEIIRSSKTSNLAFVLGNMRKGNNGKNKLKGGRDNIVINPKNKEYKVNNALVEYEDVTIRDDWEKVKDKVMIVGLVLKFTQNKRLTKELIKTAPSKLYEFTRRDLYWATWFDGKGDNRLGKLLTELRSCLIEYKLLGYDK
jgi:ribA/ribD-fused uncharacterized protein